MSEYGISENGGGCNGRECEPTFFLKNHKFKKNILLEIQLIYMHIYNKQHLIFLNVSHFL